MNRLLRVLVVLVMSICGLFSFGGFYADKLLPGGVIFWSGVFVVASIWQIAACEA